jgi:BirA family biotin operon repressor/biotin-[acetyl-CoA-carboxylase] ligase
MTVHWVPETTSVLDDLRNWYISGDQRLQHLAALRTSHQTAGRGRTHQDGQRIWESKPDQSVLIGIVVQMSATSANRLRIHLVNFIAAVAMCQMLTELVGERKSNPKINPKIKWPNDILVANKKICGILSEFLGETVVQNGNSSQLTCAVGIGLNIYQEVNDFSTTLTNTDEQEFLILPTSVRIEDPDFFNQNAPEVAVGLNCEVIGEIGQLYYKRFQEVYNQVVVGDSFDVGELYKLYLPFARVDERVRVTFADGQVVQGFGNVLADTFNLSVRTDDGQEVVVQAGDVVPVQTLL